MIRQIRFLKGECGWVNFPDGAIKPGVVNGNEVINVSPCQTEGTEIKKKEGGVKEKKRKFKRERNKERRK